MVNFNTTSFLQSISADLAKPVNRQWSTESINNKNDVLVKLQGRVEAVAAKEKTILANRALSDEGKREQLTTLGTEALPGFAFLRRVVQALEDPAARRRTELFTIEPTVTDDALRYLRAGEIRDQFRTLNETEKSIEYLKASEHANAEVMLALLDAAGGSWVIAEDRERADHERAKRLMPNLYAA